MTETVTVTVGRVALRFTYNPDHPDQVFVSTAEAIDAMITPQQLQVLGGAIGQLARTVAP